jgi:hypothetical protein
MVVQLNNKLIAAYIQRLYFIAAIEGMNGEGEVSNLPNIICFSIKLFLPFCMLGFP